MQIELKPELETYVAERVAAGDYGSTDEAVNAAVAILKLSEADHSTWAEHTRAAIQRGWDQSERGELFDSDEVFAEIERLESAPMQKAA